MIKNNLELIKGVDRATTTTISALRTAVILAQALENQKLVLDQITALNDDDVEPDPADQSRCSATPGAIQQQAASATIGLDAAARGVRRRSTRPWTPSTRSRSRRSPDGRDRGVLQNEVAKSQEYLERVRARRAHGRRQPDLR